MSQSYGETLTPSQTPQNEGLGRYADIGSAARYLRGKDRHLLHDDDPDGFDFPSGWDIDVQAKGRDIRHHNKTIFSADFDDASEQENIAALKQPATKEELKAARHNMVRTQLHHCGVIDERVLQAFRDVERDDFIPDKRGQTVAYVDKSLPVGPGRYAMEPRVLGKMLQTADLKGDEHTLVIACGTGYEMAVLSKLSGYVTGIDQIGWLALGARGILERSGYHNTNILIRELNDPASFEGKYDLILINGAVPKVPDGIDRLLVEGGKLLVVDTEQKEPPFLQAKAKLYLKTKNSFSGRTLFDANIPPLPEYKDLSFVF